MMRSKLSENAFEQVNCWVKIVHETLEKVSDYGMNILTPPKWLNECLADICTLKAWSYF